MAIQPPFTISPAQLIFVLVAPARDVNIGAAARAIKTMGFNQLRVVSDAEPGPEAGWVAHHSEDVLQSLCRHDTLQAALADVDFSIATAARRRLVRDDYLSPQDCARAIHSKAPSVQRCALVFGRESSGLTSAEIDLCDAVTSVPLAVHQPSLNLAQAVMLYAWEIHRAALVQTDSAASAPDATGSGNRFRDSRAQLSALLQQIGLGEHPRIHRWLADLLARADERDLGLTQLLMRRISQRLPNGTNRSD